MSPLVMLVSGWKLLPSMWNKSFLVIVLFIWLFLLRANGFAYDAYLVLRLRQAMHYAHIVDISFSL